MNNFKAFFKETWNRVRAKSPMYFKIIKYIGAICTLIGGLPNLLNAFNFHVYNPLFTKLIAIAGATAFFISHLTVNRAPDGSVAGDKKELPFTAQNEVKPAINKKR